MKKIILFTFLFSSVLFYGQISGLNQPNVNNYICDDNNDGFATFSMTAISAEIIRGSTTPYLVTHHLSQSDAATGANPLPNLFINSVSYQYIYARVVNPSTTQSQKELINEFNSINVFPLKGFLARKSSTLR